MMLPTAGIIVHFFNYYGNYIGTFYPKENLISGRLIVKQVETFQNYRIEIAKAFVKGIAQNIKSILYHYYRHGVKEIKPVIDFCNKDVLLKEKFGQNFMILLSFFYQKIL